MIKIFIGFDSKEKIAYHVLSQSILRQSTRPVSITPLIYEVDNRSINYTCTALMESSGNPYFDVNSMYAYFTIWN